MALLNQHDSIDLGKPILPEPNKHVEAAIDCIQRSLLQFSQEFKATTTENEPGLNQQLCDIMNLNADGYPFWFDKENMQDTTKGNSPRTDIGVKTREEIVIHALPIAKKKAFFELEAKRLPSRDNSSQKEYVTHNKMGGIERFKIGKHGKSVLYAGLIGFVQKQDFNYWHTTINGWISELFDDSAFWNPSDQLMLDKITPSVAVLHSNSKRELGISESINLIHWWVKMV